MHTPKNTTVDVQRLGWNLRELKDTKTTQSPIQVQVKNEEHSRQVITGSVMKRFVIYHGGGCRDGQFGAWACIPSDPHYELVPFQYGDKLDFERFRGHQVVFVDCSPTVEEYHELRKVAKLVTVLDHHKSSLPLAGLPGCHIDMERSGAMLAWNYFHPLEVPPAILPYIQDHDLWSWELERSREINAWVSTLPTDPELLDAFIRKPLGECAEIGRIILAQQQRQVEARCKHAFEIEFMGFSVLAVSCGIKELRSFCGEKLAKGRPFSIVFSATENDEAILSLRSDTGGIDVADLAKSLGGGGHKHAAGCTVPLSWIIPERPSVVTADRLKTATKGLIRALCHDSDDVHEFVALLLQRIYKS